MLKKEDFYYLGVVASILGEYISRVIMSLPIFAFLGYAKLGRRSIRDSKFTYMFMILLVANFGVVVSRLFYLDSQPIYVNILFLAQVILLVLCVAQYLDKNGIDSGFLKLTSLVGVPHFLWLASGLSVASVDNRFGGITGDPNYLSIDLIFALTSQMFSIMTRQFVSVKIIAYLTLPLTLYLLVITGSRTGSISFLLALILLLFFKTFSSYNFVSLVRLLGSLLLVGVCLYFLSENVERVSYIVDRLLNSERGSSMEDNERYLVWGITYDLINTTGLFEGYGREEFLRSQYHFLTHNVFLDIGLMYGSYAFYAHVLYFAFGLLLFVYRFIIRQYPVGLNEYGFFFCLVVSELLMINSVSVSERYIYWYLFAIVLVYGYGGKGKVGSKSCSDKKLS